MTNRADLAEHLRLYADLGVSGISREKAWQARKELDPLEPDEAQGAPTLAGADDATLGVGVPGGVAPGVGAPSVGAPSVAAPRVAAGGPHLSDGALSDHDTPMPQSRTLQELREEIGDCTRCVLHTLGRRQIVFGKGNPHADLMFVGEAPGADEDVQGEPFVGRAGQLLTKIIEAIDLTRDDVYIANVIKCRPPGNRNPVPDEVATCSPFLLRQIELIRPKVIVALGSFAAQALLQTKVPITKLRGQVVPFRGGDVKVIPTFHPSFLLRNQKNRDLYRDVWNDMKQARALIAAAD